MARRSNAARRDASAARRREGIRSQPLKRAAAAAVALLALARGARAADPPGSPRANQALAVCLADAATPAERRANLARRLALAGEAGGGGGSRPQGPLRRFFQLRQQFEAPRGRAARPVRGGPPAGPGAHHTSAGPGD